MLDYIGQTTSLKSDFDCIFANIALHRKIIKRRGCHLNRPQVDMVFLSTTWGVFYHIHLKENYIYPPHFDGSYSVNFNKRI